MTPLEPIRPELSRQIKVLRLSRQRMSLMSVATHHLPAAAVAAAVRAAAAPLDAVGTLADGSVGVISLRASGTDGGAGVEDRFLPRLQASLSHYCRDDGTFRVWFRSVHRWAAELGTADDIIASLFDAPARPVRVRQEPALLTMPFRPLRHAGYPL